MDSCTKQIQVEETNGKNEKENELSDIDRNRTMPRKQVKFNKD